MKAKRWLLMATVLLVLVMLGYLQFRTLRSFRWSVLETVFGSIRWTRIGVAIAMIYGAYTTRAFRWSVFLRPTKPARPATLIPSQFIGFTAVAILGRLGEFVRPYLVARRQEVTFTSQLGVYAVERVFDLLAAASIIAVSLSLSNSVSMLPHSENFRRAGYLAMLASFALGGVAVAIRFSGDRMAAIFGRAFGWFSQTAGNFVREKIHAFSHGLDTIRSWNDLLLALFWSFATWGLIALAYVEVVHAFRVPELATMPAAQTIILLASSLLGSFLQLPVVGGGSQLATIHSMISILGVSPEAATACGILLYLSTFLSVIPAGLIFARMEQVSLHSIAASSEAEEKVLESEHAL